MCHQSSLEKDTVLHYGNECCDDAGQYSENQTRLAYYHNPIDCHQATHNCIGGCGWCGPTVTGGNDVITFI